MWIKEYEISKNAYHYCIFKKDSERIRNMITHPHWKFAYILHKNTEKKLINFEEFSGGLNDNQF